MSATQKPYDPDAKPDLASHLVQVAKLGLAGRGDDLRFAVRRIANRIRATHPELSEQLGALIRAGDAASSPFRAASVSPSPLPVDLESRLHLVRVEPSPDLEVPPIWTASVDAPLRQLVVERQREAELADAGLKPTRSVLFVGPPGVGKTLAARWLAREMRRPLVSLDLAAVMSSFLGRTGGNLRQVLDYAKSTPCVLLLDELDAVAKRRDDAAEIGELKRLVTVLLQEIDQWPASGLLIAATNHPELLDPAAWRRFELVVDFPLPGPDGVLQAVRAHLGSDMPVEASVTAALAVALEGKSFSDIERLLALVRRESVVRGLPVQQLLQAQVRDLLAVAGRQARKRASLALLEGGVSQREAQGLTGVSRDTMRRALRNEAPSPAKRGEGR